MVASEHRQESAENGHQKNSQLYPREYDLVIIGAGPAGFGAAMSAASYGLNALLVEKMGSSGGIMTNGFMCGLDPERVYETHGSPLETELRTRLKQEDALFDPSTRYPQVSSNPLLHSFRFDRTNTTPDMASYVMNQMMEEAGVDFLYCTLFVDAQVEDGIITHAIVENASGRQAIEAKVFIDATGNAASVVARSGAPYISAGSHDEEIRKMCAESEFGIPIPGSLMYKMCGVDFAKLFAYQETGDRDLAKKIAEAKRNKDIPDILYRPRPAGIGAAYKGHPTLNMCILQGEGEMYVWNHVPYEWKLNCAENGDHASRAQVEMRKLIVAEWKFLKKYVPGFENSWISAIAPLLGTREGRHPVGEFMVTYKDLTNESKFDDVALAVTSPTFGMFRNRSFDVPYRAFLPKHIDNLLLSGECVSHTHEVFYPMRGIEWAMRTGELAGEAAYLSLAKGVAPKQLKWDASVSRVKVRYAR
jgi:hypothetical protein